MNVTKQWFKPAIAVAAVVFAASAIWIFSANAQQKPAEGAEKKNDKAAATAVTATTKPALTVTLTTPASAEWPRMLQANGNVSAWQEASVGTELGGFRISEVLVNVGDTVKKGQLLARLSSDTVMADLAQARASVAEAQAASLEAVANAERARQLQATGALSAQQINQYFTAEQTAKARVEAARAKMQADELRVSQTRIVAPDNGVISARAAAVGTVAQPGQELFRFIRQGRLEWRAEVSAADLAQIKPGMAATLTASGTPVRGKVRSIAPTVDPQTRNGIVYVDVGAPVDTSVKADIKAGMFARGEFELGRAKALTLPQSAVLLRDGFAYVYRVGDDAKVSQVKVNVGRRVGESVEITGGLEPNVRVVASGVGFLADGDLVRVVESAALPAKAAQK